MLVDFFSFFLLSVYGLQSGTERLLAEGERRAACADEAVTQAASVMSAIAAERCKQRYYIWEQGISPKGRHKDGT